MFRRFITVHPKPDNKNLPLPFYGQNDIILDNYIEEDLQKFLLPLNLLNFSPLPTKYKIRNNYITSNSRNVNCLSVFSVFCYIVLYAVAIALYKEFRQFNPLLMAIVLFNLLLLIFGFIINSLTNVTNSDINVDLILKIKIIKKLINFTIDFKSICFNWIFVITIVLFYLIISIIHIYNSNYSLVYTLTTVSMILFDLILIYMIRILNFLRETVRLWMSDLKEFTRVAKRQQYWNRKFTSFCEIIDAYSVYEKLCQFPVFYHSVVTFVQCLNNVQSVITFSSSNFVKSLLLLWTIKNLTLLILISFESEMFFITLKNTQAFFLARSVIDTCTGEEFLAYKRLRRVNRRVQVMMAGGVLAADASLPLRLLSVLATYTVVLLQFAFL